DNNHMEGLGLTLLEAQSQGLPVLAARTGGIPEAVDDGRTGLLFTPGDVADLKEKLSVLIGNRKLRETLGAAGPGWVAERFDWGKSLERLAGVLREAAGG
ncbi:MAG TPA: glycosyltransferase family 4 protein, partial [Fibrobacteria bacterium]|nr:glycosyltransferase family 4 protein [Fibrobacteria bacterium]